MELFRACFARLSKVVVFVALLNAPVDGSKGLLRSNNTKQPLLSLALFFLFSFVLKIFIEVEWRRAQAQ